MVDSPDSPPSRPVLIINPRSGGGKAERYGIERECAARGIEPIVFQPGDVLVDVANAAVRGGADVLGVAGGDGSQALVATVASQHDIPFVCVPAGTRNHFAFDIGIDRNDVVGTLDAFVHGSERRIDLASVNGRVFINNASFGIYARIIQSEEYRDAKVRTVARLLPDLMPPHGESFDLHFSAPDGTRWDGPQLVLVSNNPYRPPRGGATGNRGRIDDHVLGVIAVRIVEPNQIARLLATESTGVTPTARGVLSFTTPGFTIDAAAPVPSGVDGESVVLDPPLRFASLPSALRIRVARRRRRTGPPGPPGMPVRVPGSGV